MLTRGRVPAGQTFQAARFALRRALPVARSRNLRRARSATRGCHILRIRTTCAASWIRLLCLTEPAQRSAPARSALVQGRRHLTRSMYAPSPTATTTASATSWADEQLGLHPGSGGERHLAAALYPSPLARRRLRHRGLPQLSTRSRQPSSYFTPFVDRAPSRAGCASSRSLVIKSHLRSAPVVSGRAARRGLRETQISTCGTRQPGSLPPARASSSPTRKLQLDFRQRGEELLLAPLLQSSAGL